MREATFGGGNKINSYRTQDRMREQSVPYIEEDVIAKITASLLSVARYDGGAVPLEVICANVRRGTKLVVEMIEATTASESDVLATVSFNPLLVQVRSTNAYDRERYRFGLAHQLAFVLMHHSKFVDRGSCKGIDIGLRYCPEHSNPAIARLEFQAQLFASHLLMPRAEFDEELSRALAHRDVKKRNSGRIFIDEQSCNQENLFLVSMDLMRTFCVPRDAVVARLWHDNVIVDGRSPARIRLGLT